MTEPDLPDRFLQARLAPIRRELYENGEITLCGLRRLDKAVGLDEDATYRLVEESLDRVLQSG